MTFHLVKPNTKIDFIRLRYYAFALSATMILIGMVSLVMKGGPRYGIDFAGGVIMQTKFAAPLTTDSLKKSLDATNLPGLVVQRLGKSGDSEFLIRTSVKDNTTSAQVQNAVSAELNKDFPGNRYIFKRVEMVGPKVGADLRGKALEALYYAILLIAIYISGRFEHRWMAAGLMAGGLFAGITLLQYFHAPQVWLVLGALVITLGLCFFLRLNYALGAIVALIHDVLVTVGIFSILNKEFDLTIIAALLTLIGYSLNDTIIVYDRIREVLGLRTGEDLPHVINHSVNNTLSRTVLTSGLAFLAVLSLFLFGGDVIHDFALVMLIGIVVGTYSSIYVAAPIIVSLTPADKAAALTSKVVPVKGGASKAISAKGVPSGEKSATKGAAAKKTVTVGADSDEVEPEEILEEAYAKAEAEAPEEPDTEVVIVPTKDGEITGEIVEKKHKAKKNKKGGGKSKSKKKGRK